MKDKRAARMKAKRRAAKKAALEETKRQFFDDLEKKEMNGRRIRRNYDKKEAWRLNKELQWELFTKSVVSCMIVCAETLSTEYGYGKKRILQYIENVKKTLDIVGANERSIQQLSEELKLDAGIDIKALYECCELFGGKRQTKLQKLEAAAVFENAKSGMTLTMYTLYNNRNWKKQRISRFAMLAKERLIDVLENDRIDEVIQSLWDKRGVRINKNGCVEVY